MATATFYEAASRTAKSPDVRALMVELLELARERDRLQAEFAAQIIANRTRREGKRPKLSKTGRQLQSELEDDAHKAEKDLLARAPKLSDEHLLIHAFSDWDVAVELHDPAYFHADDRAFAERIDRHNRQALRRIKTFYRKRGLPIANFGNGGGGIAFIVAFQRAIPDLGTLGGDCMNIEAVLAALDKLAAKAKVPPLTEFINPDPEGLLETKPKWFDPEAGLTTVRGLLAELKRSARAVKNGKKVAEDLAVLEKDLLEAKQKRVRFHFVMLD